MPILYSSPPSSHHYQNTTMATSPLSLLVLSLFLSLSLHSQAQAPAAPAPAPPSGPVNFTAVLEKGGQFVTFMMLLNKTQTFNQVENQLNSSSEGMTIFAPTDNAFSNLKAGALNGLSQQQQVQLLQYHMLSKFYSLSNLLLVSNPVSTQASGHEGVWGLNFTVYPIDKVLLPEELFGVNRTIASPPPPPTSSGKSNSSETAAAEPSPGKNSAGGRNVALGSIVGLGLVCMGIIS
uniref:FAS1 domain-containing protein n=1 Tax=Salix viminalis TaxID=40686 RepID=A0A6N2M914_SALVM